MWCHLCKLNFTDTEIFKCHIMEKHRPESGFYKDSDCEESEPENDVVSENLESDLEMYNEDHKASSQDSTPLSDSPSDGPPSKNNASEPSSTSTPQNESRLRRSNRTKKPVSKFKIYSSSEDSETEDGDKNVNNSVPLVDNQLYAINPLGQQPLYVINPLYSNTSQLDASSIFALNSKNILEWLNKHKKLCKNLKYPLKPQLYKKVKLIHKGLISHYCMASPNEENRAILKVYENLNNMILTHIESIHAEL